MAKLNNLKACELHVHSAGSLTASDLVELARDVYHDVDWSFHEDRYKDAFGSCPDPIGLFQDVYANKPGAISRLSKHFIYTDVDGGDLHVRSAFGDPVMRAVNSLGLPTALYRQGPSRALPETIRLCSFHVSPPPLPRVSPRDSDSSCNMI